MYAPNTKSRPAGQKNNHSGLPSTAAKIKKARSWQPQAL
jgi:hypothetical protein